MHQGHPQTRSGPPLPAPRGGLSPRGCGSEAMARRWCLPAVAEPTVVSPCGCALQAIAAEDLRATRTTTTTPTAATAAASSAGTLTRTQTRTLTRNRTRTRTRTPALTLTLTLTPTL